MIWENNGNHPIRTVDRKKNLKKWKQRIRSMENIKHANLCTIGIPERGERDGEQKYIWRNCGWKLFKSKKETDTQVQEVQRVPSKINPNRPRPRQIIIKMLKVNNKDRILKAVGENTVS